MIKKIALSLFLMPALFAGTVRLYNDSPFKLRAVIRGADGSYLGEMIILPEHTATWSSDWQYYQQDNRTVTPYTVYWKCLDGGDFGIQTNVPTGGLAVAESADGPKYCKPPAPPPGSTGPTGPPGPSVEEEQLHYQNEAPPAQAPDNVQSPTLEQSSSHCSHALLEIWAGCFFEMKRSSCREGF